MSLDDINDNQYKRQQAVDACWNAIMAVLHERGLGAEQEDMIVLDLSAQLSHTFQLVLTYVWLRPL